MRIHMSIAENAATLASPCLGVCQVKGRTGFCHGCFRTLREIAGWSGFDDAERAAILEELPQREADHGDPAFLARARARRKSKAPS